MTVEEPSDAPPEIATRLSEIQARRGAKIRWQITEHTAELALRAIHVDEPPRRAGKGRRRKRHKRLL